MDQWGWEYLRPWIALRAQMPVGPLFCVIDGSSRGRPCHAHAVELARKGVPLNVIQRQLGHSNLGTTSIYLQGIDTEEIIATVHRRRAPVISATAGPRL